MEFVLHGREGGYDGEVAGVRPDYGEGGAGGYAVGAPVLQFGGGGEEAARVQEG